MKTSLSLLTIGLVLFASLLKAPAQGTAFYYQGHLTSATGGAATGSYNFTFALCNSSNGGNYIGPMLTNSAIGVSNGWFSALLDFGQVFDGNPRWLQISVSTNGASNFDTLAPLQQLTPVPYAITASNALTAATLSGQLPSASLTGNYAGAVSFNNASNTFSGTFVGSGLGLTNLPFAETFTSANGYFTFAQNPNGSTNVTYVVTNVTGVTGAGGSGGSGGGNVFSNAVVTFSAINTTNQSASATNVFNGQIAVFNQMTNAISIYRNGNTNAGWSLGAGWWYPTPVGLARPTVPGAFPFVFAPNGGPTNVWIDVSAYDVTSNSATLGDWLHLAASPAYDSVSAYETGLSPTTLVLQDSSGSAVGPLYIGGNATIGSLGIILNYGGSGEVPGGVLNNVVQTNYFFGVSSGTYGNMSGFRYFDGTQYRSAWEVTNNSTLNPANYSTLKLMKSGGTVVVGGGLVVASNAVFNGGFTMGGGAQFAGNGGGLTNLPFAETFASTNGYFSFTQNPNGSTNVTFVVTNVVGAMGAGGTGNGQPASSNLTALASNNGSALTNLAFAQTFASTNGYFSFTQNLNGSTNVTFVVTNVVGAVGAGGAGNSQPASSNLTALASNNGAGLTNLPFAETFASTNGYFSFTQNPNGSTNVTFVVTNVLGAMGAGGTGNGQPASTNLTALASNNGGALTNLPFAKTFASPNGYFSFAQNPDGSTNVTFALTNLAGVTNISYLLTNVTPAQIGAQPASSNLTVLAAYNGAGLTNLPFAETFTSANGYFTFAQNPNGSTNVTYVVTNVTGVTGAGGSGGSGGGNVFSNAVVTFSAINTTNQSASATNVFNGQIAVFNQMTNAISIYRNGNTNAGWSLGAGWWYPTPVGLARPTVPGAFPFVFAPNGGPTNVWIDVSAYDVTSNSATLGDWLHLAASPAYDSVSAYETGLSPTTLVLQDSSGSAVGPLYIGGNATIGSLGIILNYGGSGEVPGGVLNNVVQTNYFFGVSSGTYGNMSGFRYFDGTQYRSAWEVTNNSTLNPANYSTLKLMKSGGTVVVGGGLVVASNAVFNGGFTMGGGAQFAGNGGGLTNLPFAETFASTNGYFSFTQNPNGSTNVTFVVTNVVGAMGAGGTGNGQPASSNLTALASNNGSALTNLAFAQTFASTNGYFSFTQNLNGSTNVTFVVTNVVGATGAGGTGNGQPASSNLTALASNNGGALTNLPFAKTFTSTNGYYSYTQNADGSTNVAFVITNVSVNLAGAQVASSNLTVLAAGNGAGLTNLAFAETFASTNGYFSFTQNPNGSTNVTFVVTNVVGAVGTGGAGNSQPASSNLTALASNNGGALTNLPFAETFASTNGYFSFGQNPDGSTNVTFVVTNVVGATGAGGTGNGQPASTNLTALASNNGAALTGDLRVLAVYVKSNYTVSANEVAAMQTTNISYYVDTTSGNIIFTFPTPPASANVNFSVINFGSNSVLLTNQAGITFEIANGYFGVYTNTVTMGNYFDKVMVWQNFNSTNWVQLANHRTTQEIQDIAAAYVGITNGNGANLTNLNASSLTAGALNLAVLSPAAILTNGATAVGQVPTWNGTNYVWAFVSGGGGGNVYSNSAVTFSSISTTNQGAANMFDGNILVYKHQTNSFEFFNQNNVAGTLGCGWWYNGANTPVGFYRPSTNGQAPFDIIPNGGPNDSWIDICDTDVTTNDAVNGEWLHLEKHASSYSSVSSFANGTGHIQPLVLQEDGGSVGIGGVPNTTFDVIDNINGVAAITVENGNSINSAAVIQALNQVGGSGANGTVMGTLGYEWGANGVYTNNMGLLYSGANVTNGLSILARFGEAHLRFYAGGDNPSNLAMDISSNSVSIPVPISGNGSGLTNIPSSSIIGGVTTNYAIPGGATLYIVNGIITAVK